MRMKPILRDRRWSKAEMCIALAALAVLAAEVVVIVLLEQEAGRILAGMLHSLSAALISALGRLWRWSYKMVGPMLIPLLALTAVELWAVARLVRYWRAGWSGDEVQRQYKALGIIEGVSPGFGFLGTCISLMFTMHRMDPSLTQAAMLKTLLENSSSAFGSTVYGISLAIAAFLCLELFRGFLIKPGQQKGLDRGTAKNYGQATPMNLIRKEIRDARDTRGRRLHQPPSGLHHHHRPSVDEHQQGGEAGRG